MTKPKLTLVGDGSALEPFVSTTEAAAAGSAAWRQARWLHVRILAKLNSAGMLRLHNAGSLPHEEPGTRDVTPHVLSGVARELREIEAMAAEAATLLEETLARTRKR